MLCYLDKTFCSSRKHKEDCERQVTLYDIVEAEKLNLPIAYSDFCGTDEDLLSTQEVK